jgi:hypothetical protein
MQTSWKTSRLDSDKVSRYKCVWHCSGIYLYIYLS